MQFNSAGPSAYYAEYNPNTFRLTGNFSLIKPSEPNWAVMHVNKHLNYLTGTYDWHNLAVINGYIVPVAANVNLRYLSHVNPKLWPEVTVIDDRWTERSYVRLRDTVIEPDNWDLFWELWEREGQGTVGGRTESESPPWQGLIIYLDPKIDPSKFNYNQTTISDWRQYFPRMFEQIQTVMPWMAIEKVVLWKNITEISPHFDPDAKVYPWPDSMRVMLWDTNDHDTFYMTRWPERSENYNPPAITSRRNADFGCLSGIISNDKREYIQLKGTGSNTFIFNNGAWLHGADMAKPKIIMAIKGTPNVMPWLKRLGELDDHT